MICRLFNSGYGYGEGGFGEGEYGGQSRERTIRLTTTNSDISLLLPNHNVTLSTNDATVNLRLQGGSYSFKVGLNAAEININTHLVELIL